MCNFQGTLKTHKQSFIRNFSICMNVPLKMAVAVKEYKTDRKNSTLSKYQNNHI